MVQTKEAVQKLLYSVEQARHVFDPPVSEDLIRKAIKQKTLPTVRLGRLVFIPIKGLEDWIEAQAAESVAPKPKLQAVR